MKPKDNSNEIMDVLKKELSLIDDNEFIKLKEQEADEQRQKTNDVFKKSLNEFDLDEDDYLFIAIISLHLPESFLKEFGFDHNTFFDNSIEEIESKHSYNFKAFLRKLSESNVKGVATPNKSKELHKNEPIATLLTMLKTGNKEEKTHAKYEIERRFPYQDYDCQINIMRTLLGLKNFDKTWCYKTLLESWWDDALIPDIQRNFECIFESREGKHACSDIIARRFPLEYVLKNHESLVHDYEWHSRLIKPLKLAPLNQSKFSRSENVQIWLNNQIDIDDDMADYILFGYILQCIEDGFHPQYYYIHNYRHDYPFDKFSFYSDYEYFHSLLINYKPSLLFFPDTMDLIHSVIKLGNINTVVKFLQWNKRLQACIPDFLSCDIEKAVEIKQPIEKFKAYQDWSWDRFVDLIKTTCPADKESMDIFCEWKTIDEEIEEMELI